MKPIFRIFKYLRYYPWPIGLNIFFNLLSILFNLGSKKKDETILNNVTKHDSILQKLFNMINNFNAETSQYVIYCDNLNSYIKKDFAEIREIINDKINFILKEYSQTSVRLQNEQLSLKNEIVFLQKENEETLNKIVDLKKKITKMEKMIGHNEKDKNGLFKTK